MFKIIFKSLLVLSFASAAFAQDANRNTYIKSAVPKYGDHRAGQKQTVTTTTRTYKTAAAPQVAPMAQEPTEASQTLNRIEKKMPSFQEDQWIDYLMKGMSVGFEYSLLGADMHIEAKSQNFASTTYSTSANVDPASTLGVSVMYNRLGRNSIGFSAGGTVSQKIENNNGKTGSMGYTDTLTLIRPEGNFLMGHSSGFWGGIGGHLNYISGGSELDSAIEPFGLGIQLRVGFVPTRHLNFDLGYSVSMHKIGGKTKDSLNAGNMELSDENSYFTFNQWALRASYLF
jgi:hypothetical protein